MTETPSTSKAQETFQREMRRQVVLPFTFVMLVAIVGILLAFVLPQDGLNDLRAAAVGNFLLVMLLLCPMVLLLIPLYVLVVALSFGMRHLHDSNERSLAALEARVRGWRAQITTTADKLNRRGAQWSVRFAPLLAFFDLFDPSAQEKSSHDGQPTDSSGS